MTIDIISYWDRYYARKIYSSEESDFSKYIVKNYPAVNSVLDVGCGDGRDSLFFASNNKSVRGIDASIEAINLCNNVRPAIFKNCFFNVMNYNTENFFSPFDVAHVKREGSAIYARFFIHAINESQEENFLKESASAICRNSYIFLEFRNINDSKEPKIENEHYRRFINSEVLKQKCRFFGLTLIEEQHGRDLARHKEENPFISRLMYTKV